MALIISPWNYPVSLVLAPIIAAIAAGNAIVVKVCQTRVIKQRDDTVQPSELSPHVSNELERLAAKYLDPEAIVFIQGGVATATALLEQRFDFIKYTGNSAVARVIHKAATKHLTPCLRRQSHRLELYRPPQCCWSSAARARPSLPTRQTSAAASSALCGASTR